MKKPIENKEKVGKKLEVWHGKAFKTSGGKTKEDMMMVDKRVVFKLQHEAGLKRYKDTKHPFRYFGGGEANNDGDIILAAKKGTKKYKEAKKEYKEALKKK